MSKPQLRSEYTSLRLMWEKTKSFIWYGIIISLRLGLEGFMGEFFHKVQKFNYAVIPKRSGQTVVLTGGTRGIGLEVLKKLLLLDYNVLFGVRSVETGKKVLDRVRKLHGIKSGTAKCFSLDLKSLRSVQKFANNVLKETDRIDLLINNAGVMFEPYGITEDLNEIHFQVNFLSHHYLTKLLLPTMKTTGIKKNQFCRIVNVSSIGHSGSHINNLLDVSNPRVFSPYRAYYDSKFCQILSTKYLDAQLKSEGAKVQAFSLHPGVIPTDLYTNLGIFGKFIHYFHRFYRTMDEGAEIIIFTAISPKLEFDGGAYIHNCRVQSPHKMSEDLSAQRLLWELSERRINQNSLS